MRPFLFICYSRADIESAPTFVYVIIYVGATIGRPCEEILSFICRGGYYPPALNSIYHKNGRSKNAPTKWLYFWFVGTVRPTFAFGKLAKFALRTSRLSVPTKYYFTIGNGASGRSPPTNYGGFLSVGAHSICARFYLSVIRGRI